MCTDNYLTSYLQLLNWRVSRPDLPLGLAHLWTRTPCPLHSTATSDSESLADNVARRNVSVHTPLLLVHCASRQIKPNVCWCRNNINFTYIKCGLIILCMHEISIYLVQIYAYYQGVIGVYKPLILCNWNVNVHIACTYVWLHGFSPHWWACRCTSTCEGVVTSVWLS